MGHALKTGVKGIEMPLQGSCTVEIKGGADLLGNTPNLHAFAVEPPVFIGKMIHLDCIFRDNFIEGEDAGVRGAQRPPEQLLSESRFNRAMTFIGRHASVKSGN